MHRRLLMTILGFFSLLLHCSTIALLHFWTLSWKMLPLNVDKSGFLPSEKKLFTYEDDALWKWAELVESVEKLCKAGMFALWIRWDFWLHHEAQTSPEPWDFWICLCEGIHSPTHTLSPDVHLALISNVLQFLNISLFGTAATSYGAFH